jgi:ubiquinone/menaquinone biosynthesis C-methylase UbiE
MLMLDVGCGENKYKGAIGLDSRKTKFVDVVADANHLPFKTGAFDHLYSSNTIEHFSHKDVHEILNGWVRCLRKGGVLEICCPDLRARAFFFFLNPSWGNIRGIYGAQDHSGNFHKCGFSYAILKSLLEASGITNVHRIIDGYKGIRFLPNCLHVKGEKR